MQKTNVMRLLDQAAVSYTPHTYPHPKDAAVDGVQVAALTGQDPAKVFKTLVTRSSPKDYYVFVIPVAGELDLKKAARAVGAKAVEMLHVKELLPLTGYVRGGCSPIGMKKPFPTVIDQRANAQDTILVSAGKIGFQVEIRPHELQEFTGAAFADVLKDNRI